MKFYRLNIDSESAGDVNVKKLRKGDIPPWRGESFSGIVQTAFIEDIEIYDIENYPEVVESKEGIESDFLYNSSSGNLEFIVSEKVKNILEDFKKLFELRGQDMSRAKRVVNLICEEKIHNRPKPYSMAIYSQIF